MYYRKGRNFNLIEIYKRIHLVERKWVLFILHILQKNYQASRRNFDQ